MSEFDDEFDNVLADFDVDQAVQQHVSPSAANVKESTPIMMMDNNDELDDALANFDVDKAVQQHESPSASKAKENVSRDDALVYTNVEELGRGTKKRKVLESEDALQKTLHEFYGFSAFRKGQVEVIQALIQKRDVSVYWATGKGKSMCYQLPALHLDSVAFVVSPLISLMQDQCHKLNALSHMPLATYLGSAQTDQNAEEQAWRGVFPLVYLTPEKLTTCLGRMAKLHQEYKSIALVAIDEAHTVSEWGTDFRPDFRKLSCLRQDAALKKIPILTLTATAVTRVQLDITQVLKLRNPFVSQQSLDRKNLCLMIHTRPSNPISALLGYIKMWNDPAVRPSQHSTIIYVATRKEVDQLASALISQVSNPAVVVCPYHAGLSPEARKQAHTDFLTGKCTVLVATVAFGMGIDKPDTRRIIHWGPPKSFEEYYQQIGRAGRDGAKAEAVLFTSGTDFNKYQDDFYVGKLTPDARKATLDSLQALKHYSMDKSQCRRKVLLSYFGETPTFQYCNNCDFCQQIETFGDDMERDFRETGALLILDVVGSLKDQALGQITKAINGNAIEAYRCRIPVSQLQAKVQTARASFPRKFSAAYFEQLLSSLEQKNYVFTKQVTSAVGGHSRTWTIYGLTPLGQQALRNKEQSIVLPVPEYLRALEKKDEERRQKVLEDLQNSGFKDKIPSDELEQGDGEVIRAYAKWQTYVEKARGMGKTQRVEHLDSLLTSIEDWRARMAAKNEMAPVSVIPEHILAAIAYAVATLPPGNKMDSSSLIAAGVRSREIDSLITVLGDWVDKFQSKVEVAVAGAEIDIHMTPFKIPARSPWKFAMYKPQKKTDKAIWEQSYDRYAMGESLQSIAMSPAPGRQPIQAKTVAGHIVDAIVHGREVDPAGIIPILPLPSRSEWEQIEKVHETAGMDPVADPETSGLDSGKYTLTDAIRPIIPGTVDIPHAERSDADRAVLGHWFDRLKWYLALKRGGIEPRFE
eukprot:scaffold9782_cov150-Amphora_coffeaeformis.AAC.5